MSVEAVFAAKMTEAVSLIAGRWAPTPGALHDFKWKAIDVNGGDILFELGPPLQDLHFGLYKKGDFEVSRFFRWSRELLEVLLGQVGESFGEHFFASKLSVLRRGRQHTDDEDQHLGLVNWSTKTPYPATRASFTIGVAEAHPFWVAPPSASLGLDFCAAGGK